MQVYLIVVLAFLVIEEVSSHCWKWVTNDELATLPVYVFPQGNDTHRHRCQRQCYDSPTCYFVLNERRDEVTNCTWLTTVPNGELPLAPMVGLPVLRLFRGYEGAACAAIMDPNRCPSATFALPRGYPTGTPNIFLSSRTNTMTDRATSQVTSAMSEPTKDIPSTSSSDSITKTSATVENVTDSAPTTTPETQIVSKGQTGTLASTSDKATETTTPIEVKSCPPKWSLLNGQCFRPYFLNATFATATTMCSYSNATLATVHSMDENIFASGLTNGVTAWIGIEQVFPNSTFSWIDNSPTSFANWAPHEPSAAGSCVSMSGTAVAGSVNIGDWVAQDCDAMHGYICKKKA